ncbi:flavin reductase family protein [Isoalcanivorax indicus]|uniref:flavin reductase family protein n=1 Tax=Isoalcanivorax indicus TaxID=2202653 RepID=UPI000DB93B30|nr:iron-sulfur cluster-binding domain-containing protein [Isoalcanivorax indicus]
MPATGALKRLMTPLINPAAFDFWVGQVSPLLAWERPLARIVAREVSARDTVTLVLKPNRHVAPVLPGQHVPVTVEVGGRRLTRQYSPTQTGKRLAITVKRVPGGAVSTHLTRDARVGDVLELGAPFGTMRDDPAVSAWLFAAAGSGITPLMSLLRAQAARGQVNTTLLYWARTRADLCFLPELQQMARDWPGMTLIPVLTREAVLASGEASGRPEAALLARHVPDLADRHVYACGPAGFVAQLEQLTGDTARSVLGEAFTPPERVSVVGAPVQVTLARSGRVLEIPAGEALLPALEAQGETPAFGCRMGVCHTCACQRLDGTSEDLFNGRQHSEPGMLRLCVSAARSHLTLDL